MNRAMQKSSVCCIPDMDVWEARERWCCGDRFWRTYFSHRLDVDPCLPLEAGIYRGRERRFRDLWSRTTHIDNTPDRYDEVARLIDEEAGNEDVVSALV